MKYKKINYFEGEPIAKIKIVDVTGALKDNWTIMLSDLAKFTREMAKKYQIDNAKVDDDLKWAI